MTTTTATGYDLIGERITVRTRDGETYTGRCYDWSDYSDLYQLADSAGGHIGTHIGTLVTGGAA
jgi:hypothetical protein